MRFSEPIYDIMYTIQQVVGVSREKDPELLQLIGDSLKLHYGADVWVRNLLDKIPPNKKIVIGDVRHQVEVRELNYAGIPILRINRRDRIIDRNPTHISEIDLDDYPFDYVIDNDGLIEELYEKIDMFMETVTKL